MFSGYSIVRRWRKEGRKAVKTEEDVFRTANYPVGLQRLRRRPRADHSSWSVIVNSSSVNPQIQRRIQFPLKSRHTIMSPSRRFVVNNSMRFWNAGNRNKIRAIYMFRNFYLWQFEMLVRHQRKLFSPPCRWRDVTLNGINYTLPRGEVSRFLPRCLVEHRTKGVAPDCDRKGVQVPMGSPCPLYLINNALGAPSYLFSQNPCFK